MGETLPPPIAKTPIVEPAPRPEPPTTRPAPAVETPNTGPPAATGSTGPESVDDPPQLLSRSEPAYPERLRKRGDSGVVELRVLVNEQGRVIRVVVTQGIPGSELEALAVDAALRSTYSAGKDHGRPVRAWVTERFVFGP